jgi:exodeoxyribonuclease III
MKIATFNANSIRARLDIVLDWVKANQPDVLAIQETKVVDSEFPAAAFEDAGYQVAYHGQKSYNGVAIASKKPLEDVRFGFQDPLWWDDCRILSARIDGVNIVNTYVPNGTQVGTDKFDYKLRWLERFGRMLDERHKPGDPVVWLGDINIAPTDDDVFDPVKLKGSVCFHPEEKQRLSQILEWGLTDTFRKFTKGTGHFSYWEFFIQQAFTKNLGWRIDHIYASAPLEAACTSASSTKGRGRSTSRATTRSWSRNSSSGGIMPPPRSKDS